MERVEIEGKEGRTRPFHCCTAIGWSAGILRRAISMAALRARATSQLGASVGMRGRVSALGCIDAASGEEGSQPRSEAVQVGRRRGELTRRGR